MADQIDNNGSSANSVLNAVVPIADDNNSPINFDTKCKKKPGFGLSISFLQKLIAEGIGTFFIVFAGCAAIKVNLNNDKVVTLPGIATVWGLAVMIMIYSVGYISGAHFNPAVTIAFASCTCGKFPWKQAHLLFLNFLVMIAKREMNEARNKYSKGLCSLKRLLKK